MKDVSIKKHQLSSLVTPVSSHFCGVQFEKPASIRWPGSCAGHTANTVEGAPLYSFTVRAAQALALSDRGFTTEADRI